MRAHAQAERLQALRPCCAAPRGHALLHCKSTARMVHLDDAWHEPARADVGAIVLPLHACTSKLGSAGVRLQDLGSICARAASCQASCRWAGRAALHLSRMMHCSILRGCCPQAMLLCCLHPMMLLCCTLCGRQRRPCSAGVLPAPAGAERWVVGSMHSMPDWPSRHAWSLNTVSPSLSVSWNQSLHVTRLPVQSAQHRKRSARIWSSCVHAPASVGHSLCTRRAPSLRSTIVAQCIPHPGATSWAESVRPVHAGPAPACRRWTQPGPLLRRPCACLPSVLSAERRCWAASSACTAPAGRSLPLARVGCIS